MNQSDAAPAAKVRTFINILHFSIAVTLSKIIGAATTFCAATLLIPADYGVWTTLTLIISLSTIFLLGSVETLIKQVPFYLGESNDRMIAIIDGGVLASVYLSAATLLLLSLAFLIPGLIFENNQVQHYLQIALVTAAISLFSCFYYYRLSAFSRFKEVSILNSSRAFITFLAVIALGWKWHLMGMIVGGLCAELSTLALSLVLNRRLERTITLQFAVSLLWSLIKVGFPITMVWWAYMVLTSVGRIISISMLGKAATGYYSLGVSIVSLIILVPAAIGQVLYPQVSERVGGKASHESISRYVVFPAQVMSVIIPLLLGILILATPLVIKLFFPKYVPGISSAQILFLGAFFICFIKNGVNFLVAHDKQNEVFLYVLASLLVTVSGSIAAVKLHYGIEGLAAGTTAGCLLLTTLIWKAAFMKLGYSFRNQAKKIGELYAPFLCMVALILLITVSGGRYSISPVAKAVASVPAFIVLYLAALWSVPFLRSWCGMLMNELNPAK